MAKGMSTEVYETNKIDGKNKIRKVLQTLQVPANERKVLERNMNQNDKAPISKEKLDNVTKLKMTEKENVPNLRRSRRKNVASSIVNYVESPDVSKTSKSSSKTVVSKSSTDVPKATKSSVKTISKSKKTVKTKKGCSVTVKKNEQTKLNQTKLLFSPAGIITEVKEIADEFEAGNSEKLIDSTNEIIEDSGFDPSDQGPSNSTAIIQSPNEKMHCEVSVLIGDTPPLSYWQDLAEQRRLALEKALHENELLHDQLIVLEAENSQLKQLVREAENLAQAIGAVVE